MRISTQSFYQQSQTAMNSLQSNLLRTQQQIGAMTKILAPSDDPLGATRALAVSQSIALGAQYAASRGRPNKPCRWKTMPCPASRPFCKTSRLCW